VASPTRVGQGSEQRPPVRFRVAKHRQQRPELLHGEALAVDRFAIAVELRLLVHLVEGGRGALRQQSDTGRRVPRHHQLDRSVCQNGLQDTQPTVDARGLLGPGAAGWASRVTRDRWTIGWRGRTQSERRKERPRSECRRLLVDETPHGYVHEDAWQLVEGYREDFRTLLSRGGQTVQIDDQGRALWWTFAGGRINHTLKYALGHTTGWKIVADNFRLRFEGDGITHGSVERAIVALSEGAFWDDLSAWQRILETMPVYRLSKFQPALPVQFQREMVGRYAT
jgi:hypothetical protein